MSFESCGVLPRIVTDLKEAREELQTTGAVIFEHIDCTEAGTRAFAREMFGDRLRALVVQPRKPIGASCCSRSLLPKSGSSATQP